MNLLITAGNTLAMIDQVRAITNVFTGRTGAAIAVAAHQRGHACTILTSHPETAHEVAPSARWRVLHYRTFEDLEKAMQTELATKAYDAVVHCAAVSDYRCAGVYAASANAFDPQTCSWAAHARMQDRAAAKVKSDEPELWLRLTAAPKLIDEVRTAWGFTGVLVKFKLEVGVEEDRLLQIAEAARVRSKADLMVANTLEGASQWAYLGSSEGYERVERGQLPARLIAAIQEQHRRRAGHG